MRAVGVRELQSHASRILKEVTTRRQPVAITRHGRVIARIVPVDEVPTGEERAQVRRVLTDLERLSEEISARWPKGLSAVDAVSRERR